MIVRCRVCHRVQPLDGYKTCPGCLERNAVRLRRHRERRAQLATVPRAERARS